MSAQLGHPEVAAAAASFGTSRESSELGDDLERWGRALEIQSLASAGIDPNSSVAKRYRGRATGISFVRQKRAPMEIKPDVQGQTAGVRRDSLPIFEHRDSRESAFRCVFGDARLSPREMPLTSGT